MPSKFPLALTVALISLTAASPDSTAQATKNIAYPRELNRVIAMDRVTRNIFAFLVAAALTCSAQTKPAGACSFDGFDAAFTPNPTIAEVATKAPAPALSDCDSPKGCRSFHVAAGSPVLVYKVEDGWTCGYAADSRSAGPVWLRSADVRPVSYERDAPLSAWVGWWSGGEDRIHIDLSRSGASLHLQGKATWHGAGGIEHYGSIAGDAMPDGNRLHFSPNGPDQCTVDLVLFRKFIVAKDNGLCGALNVRFWGLWRRSASRQRGSGVK
jgi:hypothetical protein